MTEEEGCRAFSTAADIDALHTCAELLRYESPLVGGFERIIPWRKLSVNPKIPLRLPFATIGVLLGLSLWFIANKWYGPEGGLLALALYCCSPLMVIGGSEVDPTLLATWGFYGAVFLAVATAHSLYAPPGSLGWWREWRNPLLFGITLGVGSAAHFWCLLSLPFAFSYSLFLAPGSRRKLIFSLGVACCLAALVLCACYSFSPEAIVHAIRSAEVVNLKGAAVSTLPMAKEVARTDLILVACTALALLAWCVTRPARHFTNTASLLIIPVVPMFAMFRREDYFSFAYTPVVPFAAMFIGGVFADLMQTRYSRFWRVAAFCLGLAAAITGIRTVAQL